ncbi:MAG: hypothetical protein GYB66_15735 [Chloroflexi bacterium]|nr:hypothetical protein [Chloroflexota bacterium]
MYTRKFSIIPVILSLVMTVALLLTAIGYQAVAQVAPTPTPSADDWYLTEVEEWDLPYTIPGSQSGDATWSVKAPRFESHYPRGFTFSVEVASSAADVELASVIWSHTPNRLQRLETRDIDPDTGTIEITWRPDESLPPWVAVNFYWSLVDSAGNRYATNWILNNEYADVQAGWTRVESQDVVIFLQEGVPEEAIDLTVDAMATQRATFEQAWGGALSYKPRVVLFENQRDFQEWRLGFGGSSVIGQTSQEWGATVQVLNDGDVVDLAYGTVLHEIGHLYQFEFAPDAFDAGSWLTEGNATLFELHQQYDYEARIRNIAEAGRLPVLLQGSGPFAASPGPDGIGRYGYDVGYTFWKWLVVNFGLDAHRAVIERLAAGTPRNVVFQQVTGLSQDEIERQWATWLGASGPAPTLVPTWTLPAFPATSTPFQFNTPAAE